MYESMTEGNEGVLSLASRGQNFAIKNSRQCFTAANKIVTVTQFLKTEMNLNM